MTANQNRVTTTERKIGKVTYIVRSSTSAKATETLENKIKTLIKKEASSIAN